MMKYLIALGIVVAAVVAFFVFSSAPTPPAQVSEPAVATPPAPEPEPEPVAAPEAPSDDTLLEQIAADTRENLPTAMTDAVTWTDALFLPRMRIMEYSYVIAASDAAASANNPRDLIAARTETLCLDQRDMFELGTTLRNSFENSSGQLIDRVYLLPEDCQRFY